MNTNIHFLSYFAPQFLEPEVYQKNCKENRNIFCIQYFFFENRAVYKIMWKNILQPDSPQMTIWLMSSHAGYLSLSTHTQNM
jgi:hypothetical protein